MTKEQFDSMRHSANQWVKYKGQLKYVISLCFDERLFALVDEKIAVEAEEWQWVRCEHVTLHSN